MRNIMSNPTLTTSKARRQFLKFLAASPYVAALGGVTAYMRQSAFAQSSPAATDDLITEPAQALDVYDFEEVAHQKVLRGHWAYMTSGVDDDATVKANHEGYQHVELRPRRLRDATHLDMRVDLFGTTYNSPVYLCPTGGDRSFHPEGEVAVARAAKARGTMQVLSTDTSMPVEDVIQALGRPVWQQFYSPNQWEAATKIMDRVQAAGVTVLALTVDRTAGRNSETFLRLRGRDLSSCAGCHDGGAGPKMSERPMYKGIDMKGVLGQNPAMDWAWVDRIRQAWKGKFLIKGIDTREDAALCVQHGLDGIMVSNHGGRSINTLRPTIEALPEVVTEVNGRIPVFVDGGVRRGTDVFKALALGAKAVGIGRPMLWGLGAFGQPGVDRVIEILQGELKLAMGNCGTRTIADITREYVATPDWKG